MSQKILQYIEIDVDYCSLTYSVAPCQAHLTDELTNTTLLLHMEGTPGSTTFTDSSPVAHGNATVFGNAQVGGGGIIGNQLALDGVGDYLTFPDHANWDFGSSDFTVEWWEFRTIINSGGRTAISRDSVTAFSPFIFGIDPGGGGILQAYATSDGANWNILNGLAMGTMVQDTWVHRAITREGNNFRTWQNGVFVSSATSSAAIFANANALSIGNYSGSFFQGSLDEIRISSVARYNANFIPADHPFSTATG